MDWRAISDIAGSETMYTLTGLEEGTEYSITVTTTITEVRTQQSTITVTTMAAGESTSKGFWPFLIPNHSQLHLPLPLL